MNNQLFSEQWYRVADLKPKLKASVAVHRQIQRNKVWYLLQDKASGRTHRLDIRTYRLVAQLAGKQTMNELWLSTVEADEHSAPTQQDVIQLISQLHQSDLINTDITPDIEEIFYRQQKRKRARQLQLVNPLSFKAPLFNPERLLTRLERLGRWISTPGFLLLWAAIITAASIQTAMHWDDIFNHGSAHLTSPHYWLLIWLVYPVIKAVHELAHGLLIRRFGGEVNEMGVSLLVLMPVPYVNASEASTFKSKWHRIAVSAAGIMAELLLAAIALFIWLHTADGLVRDIAFVTMTIGGLSTLLFNGNPLMKYDGYYVFSDLLEIPNLAKSAKKQWSYLARKYLLRIDKATSPATTRTEARWLAAYGASAWTYRLGITFLLAAFFSKISLFLAAGIVLLMLYGLLIKPTNEIIHYLRHSPEISRHRTRSWVVALLLLLAIFSGIAFIPAPYYSMAQGVVWLPEEAEIRSVADGFVERLELSDGDKVSPGDRIMTLENPTLDATIDEARAHLNALKAKLNAAENSDLVLANKLRDEIAAANAALHKFIAEQKALTITAKRPGTLIIPDDKDLPGRYISRGDVVAYILDTSQRQIRAVITQDDEQLVRNKLQDISVVLSDEPGKIFSGKMIREMPASVPELPSPALSLRNGGVILTDPADRSAKNALTPVFVVDLKLDGSVAENIGARAWVRFNHGNTPLLQQWRLKWRQLFLQHVTANS
ncbi:MAG: site-2 protease family protein [Thiotrichales bacterium]